MLLLLSLWIAACPSATHTLYFCAKGEGITDLFVGNCAPKAAFLLVP